MIYAQKNEQMALVFSDFFLEIRLQGRRFSQIVEVWSQNRREKCNSPSMGFAAEKSASQNQPKMKKVAHFSASKGVADRGKIAAGLPSASGWFFPKFFRGKIFRFLGSFISSMWGGQLLIFWLPGR